ncbi:hypothetical protein BG003_002530 [Podila horticola]|nr:hypothetical protein BG003_002530 [Podila horticola]
MSTPRPSEEGHTSGTSPGNNITHIPRHPQPHPHAHPHHQRPHFNNSFDQPTEPFECDVSAILPYDDDDEEDEDEDEEDENQDEDEEDIAYPHSHDEERETRSFPGHMKDHQERGSNQESKLAKYQHASTKEGSSHDDRLQARYLQVEPEWVYEDNYPNTPYLDDDQMGGHTRLSTIAEMSEMPSINITNSQDKLRPDSKTKNFKTRPEVISRDLVLEDLFVDGEREEEAHRQELLANLKPNDILGPIHETRGFHISSLTGQRNSRAEHERDELIQESEDSGQDQEALEQEQSRESTQRCYQDSIEEALENDMDESALALKREFERMFGPKGAVDSERSGSDVGLEAYDNSEDLYGAHEEDEEGEDDDDVFFANDDDEVDEQEEEYYAMLDLNGGNTNMILGNNIPRKPKVLAPPPGSRLPIPRFAQTAKPPATVDNKPMPPSGLRPPQVIAKPISPPPEPREPTPPITKSGSILDGLWSDLAEHDSIPEQSPGAIFAAQVAAELLKEEREKKPEIRPRGLRPPQVRSKLREDIDTVAALKVESIPNPAEVAVQSTPRPNTISSIPSRVPGLSRSAIPPPKVRGVQPISPQASANGGNASGTKTPTPTTPSLSRLPVKLASRPSSQSPARSLGSPRSSPQSNSPTPTQSPRAPSRAQLQERPSTQKQKPSTSPSGSEFRKSTSVYQERSPGGENVASTLRASTSRPFDQYARSSQINREGARPKEGRELNRIYSPEPVAGAHHQGEDRNLARLQRKLQLQKELQEIEEEEKAAEMQRRRKSADRPKLSVRTESRAGRGQEYPHEHHHRRLSNERLDSGSPLSPLSPRSPLSSKVISPRSSAYLGEGYKRSSIYDVKDGHRLSREGHLVPTLEESCKQLAKIRQEIVELRKEVLQVSGSLATQQGSSSSSKQLTRHGHFPDRRDSVDSKYYVHGTRSQLSHIDSLQSSSEPSSPEIMSTIVATPRRKMIGDILGKFRRSVMNPPAPSGTDSNHVIVVDIVVRSWP